MLTGRVIMPILLASAGLYGMAWGFYLARRQRAGDAALTAGWGLTGLVIALNWMRAGAPPFGGIHQVLVVLAWCLPALYRVTASRIRIHAGAHFAFTAAVIVTGALFAGPGTAWRQVPALQSPWFVPHVLSYMLAYALAAIAFSVLLTVPFKRDGRIRRRQRQSAYRLARLGFPFMTMGLLTGALWADAAWGVYWSWDMKETWALITWLFYLACLQSVYARRTRRLTAALHGLAFTALMVTFLAVNFLPRMASTQHGYAAPSRQAPQMQP